MLQPRSLRHLARAAFAALLAMSLSVENKGIAQPGNTNGEREGNTIRETKRRVLVDVVVTGRDGKPVRGLTRDDFTVTEDEKPQPIRSFAEQGSALPEAAAPKPETLPVNTFTDVAAEENTGPLYILVYDMVNTEPDDQASALRPLLDFVHSLPRGIRLALYVNSDGLHLLEGFTSDESRLRAALLGQGSGPHLPKRFMLGDHYGKGDPLFTLREFQILAQNFQRIPGRKNLIWLCGEMPAALTVDPNHDHAESLDAGKEALAALARSQIAVYPVDLKGVSFDSERPVGGSADGGETAASAPGAASTVMLRGNSDAIGTLTGGLAYHGSNNVADLLRKAVEHGRNYYSLSYSPVDEKYDYAARHISVSLAQKGNRLSYRRIYYALPEDRTSAPPDTPQNADSLPASVEHGGPMRHEVLFQVHLSADPALPATAEQIAGIEDRRDYFRTRRRMPNALPVTKTKMQTYHIEYTVLDPRLKTATQQSGLPADLEFAAVAYGTDGRILNGMIDEAQSPSTKKDHPESDPPFIVRQQLDAPVGAVSIRLVVRDTATDRTGTVEVALPLGKEPDAKAANH